MTTEALKSASITNDDAVPTVLNTAGAGAASTMNVVDDYVTVSASMAALSTYRLVRVPTTAKVKSVVFESEAQGAGKFQLGVYAPNGGAVVSVKLFSDDIDCASAVLPTEKVGSSTYTLDKRKQPLWQAAGAASDPGGFYDIVATVHTTDVTTGTGKLGVRVAYAN